VRTMSQENVELTRRLVDGWNRRDLKGMLALADPEVEFVNSPSAVEPGTRRGRDEVTAVLRMQWETLLDGHLEIDRIYDRGDEIIILAGFSRRMPGSDTRLEGGGALLSWQFREGKLIRMKALGVGTEVEDALKAAGLDE
jgi:ketosteroid isomerase-like protein